MCNMHIVCICKCNNMHIVTYVCLKLYIFTVHLYTRKSQISFKMTHSRLFIVVTFENGVEIWRNVMGEGADYD